MKKLLSLALSLALSCSLVLPAAAAESGDARLSAVTQKVKTALGLDTEAYDQFYGDLSENELSPTWSLSWSGEPGSIEVMATEEGKVLRYSRYDNSESYSYDSLSLPDGSPEEAFKAAQVFASGLLGTGESLRLDPPEGQLSLGTRQYRFSGVIDLNGLPSPLSCSVTVRGWDNEVIRFSRDDLSGAYMGGVPSSVFKTNEAAAGKLLRGTLSLRLEYVLGEDGRTARLRYLPNDMDEYYVDDVTGKLVNLTELYRQAADGGRNGTGGGAAPEASAAMDADSKSSYLTQAEQTGVDKLAGVLDKAALDQKAAAVTELGLSKYTLAAVTYDVERTDQDDETLPSDAKVTAQLTYARQSDEGIFRRYVTLDAKTGALLNVRSSTPWSEDYKAAVQESAARNKAERFLSKYWGDEFAKTALIETPDVTYRIADDNPRSWGLTYAQKENGYFFPDNALRVGIDSADGSVSSFSRSWDGSVVFDSAEGVVSMDKAIDVYLGTFTLQGGYMAVPEKLDLSSPEWKPLAEMGYTYLYTLKLGYGLADGLEGGYLLGIDAKTGEALIQRYETDGIAYDDLETAPWAKTAIESLAGYGVGYTGGSFQPGKTMTQLDLVALLASTQGALMDPENLTDPETDSLYQTAYSMGVLTRAERDDGKLLTRMDVVKLLLDAGGYTAVARLQGIYQVSFTDAASIPGELLGYAALAQGLGLVGGDGAGSFAPDRAATRAEAAVMLYAFMGRAK